MFDKLKTVEQRYETLMGLVSDAAVQADPAEYRAHAKALAEIQPLVDKFASARRSSRRSAQARELAQGDDPEMRKPWPSRSWAS